MREVIQEIIATESEAKALVEMARAEAERILSDARKKGQDMVERARQDARVVASNAPAFGMALLAIILVNLLALLGQGRIELLLSADKFLPGKILGHFLHVPIAHVFGDLAHIGFRPLLFPGPDFRFGTWPFLLLVRRKTAAEIF